MITLLEGLRTRRELKGKPALIVVPTSLITNWQRETARFAPKLKLHVYYGPGRALPGEKETVHAVLTTYGTLRSSVNTLAERAWRLLILDEAQAVKNYRTSTFKSVRTVKADGVVAMSGTPVENRLMEYWSIMEATNPGLLGSATGFKNTFAQPSKSSTMKKRPSSLSASQRPLFCEGSKPTRRLRLSCRKRFRPMNTARSPKSRRFFTTRSLKSRLNRLTTA